MIVVKKKRGCNTCCKKGREGAIKHFCVCVIPKTSFIFHCIHFLKVCFPVLSRARSCQPSWFKSSQSKQTANYPESFHSFSYS